MKLLVILIAVLSFTKLCGQSYPAFEQTLKKELSEDSREDGRWVFYSDKANIEKIEKPKVKAVLSNYDFYKVTLTNYLGYHVNQGTCMVLFDSLNSKIVLVEPIWYGGVSEPLVKLCLKKSFESKQALLDFLSELHGLMEIGSGYKFVNTSSTDNLIRYDMVYSEGDSYTTGGNGTTSTVHYRNSGVWRKIEIKVKDFKMVEYVSINPRLENDKEFKEHYKEIIK